MEIQKGRHLPKAARLAHGTNQIGTQLLADSLLSTLTLKEEHSFPPPTWPQFPHRSLERCRAGVAWRAIPKQTMAAALHSVVSAKQDAQLLRPLIPTPHLDPWGRWPPTRGVRIPQMGLGGGEYNMQRQLQYYNMT